jgi:alkanesulfonate monooxygenase SsuD/methylene tetrahydromethanopterin reductase-like flavin-dependent oxidoreductase (luciferase family)
LERSDVAKQQTLTIDRVCGPSASESRRSNVREVSVTSFMNSMIFAALTRSPRIRYRSVRAAALFVIITVALGAHASAATDEAEARALFAKFVAAQNAHSVSDVKTMLWNSPGMLLLARGVEVRGPEAVADRFKEYYEGHGMSNPTCHNFT